MDLEKLSNRRIVIVTSLGLTFLFFQLFSLRFIAEWTGWDESLLNRLEDGGLFAFVIALLAFGYLARKVEGQGVLRKAQFYDELVKAHFHQAMIAGFKVLFLMGALLFILCQFIAIEGEDIARIIMTLGFVIPYLRFAYLEAQNA